MARIGQGAQLQYSTDGVTYTSVAELTEIGEFGVGEGDDIDTTSHDSLNGFRDFTRGLIDPGEISFSGNWVGASSQQVPSADILAGPTTTLAYFKVILPSNLGTWTGRGYWKSFNVNPQLDDLLEFSGAVKVSGKPTFNVP